MEFFAITEALRIFSRSLNRQFLTHYKGSPQTICENIVKDCFNGTYFQTSAGHFSGFYVRDFAWVVEALLHLGYKNEVQSTLTYALEQFAKKGRIATTLTPRGNPVDIHDVGPDSFALLLFCLHKAKMHALVKKHKKFLEYEARRYVQTCFNTKLGLVLRHKYFSSMKDMYKRDSSAYDNWMMLLMKNELDYFKLKNPLKKYNLERAIEKNFFRKTHYVDDLRNEVLSGDANITPLFYGLITDKKRGKYLLKAIQDEGLCTPFPLRYTQTRRPSQELTSLRLVAGNYEGTSIWLHMGVQYLKSQCYFDTKEAKKTLEKFEDLIEKHRTFPEVLSADGKKPFSTWAYFCDEGMIWAANVLYAQDLLREKKQGFLISAYMDF